MYVDVPERNEREYNDKAVGNVRCVRSSHLRLLRRYGLPQPRGEGLNMNIKEIGGFSSSWIAVLLILPVALLAASYAVVVGAVVGAYRELRDVINTF